MSLDLDKLGENVEALNRYAIQEVELSKRGARLIWRDPEDHSNPYTVASSEYNESNGSSYETGFLVNALPLLQAAEELVAIARREAQK